MFPKTTVSETLKIRKAFANATLTDKKRQKISNQKISATKTINLGFKSQKINATK